MTVMTWRRLVLLLVLTALRPAPAAADVERRFERSFTVSAASMVFVDVAGASITTEPGARGEVRFTVVQQVGTDSDAEADQALARFTVDAAERGREVHLRIGTTPESWRRGHPRVRMTVHVRVPDNVPLDLETSGGSIVVRGDRSAPLEAETSGGSVTVEGGSGTVAVSTAGGSIKVNRALTELLADTSGGGISVGYVGPTATRVNLDTSGGSIRVGVDPRARLDITASTSGGRVTVEGLALGRNSSNRRQNRISGSLNGGGGILRAATSGGSIIVAAVVAP